MLNVASAFRSLLCPIVVACAGCQSLQTVVREAPELQEVSQPRKARQADVATSFDQQRNDVQVTAARARWQEGDVVACLELVDKVLSRQPDHPAANELLATVEREAGIAASATLDSPAGAFAFEELSDSPSPSVFQSSQPLFEAPGVAPAAESFRSVAAAVEPLPQVRNQAAGPVAQAATVAAEFILPAQPMAPLRPQPTRQAPPVQTFESRSGTVSLHEAGRALARGEVGRAQQILQAALAADPHNHSLAVSVAALPLRYNQPDLSVVLASQALARFNDSAELLRVAGTAHYRRGDYQSSQLALRQALSLDNAHPLTYFLLGLALRRTGDLEAADWHLRQARQRDTQSALRR